MISRTLNVDGKPAVSLKKQNERKYLKSHTVAKFVTGMSDLETETVILYERTDKYADSEADGQHE